MLLEKQKVETGWVRSGVEPKRELLRREAFRNCYVGCFVDGVGHDFRWVRGQGLGKVEEDDQ